MDFADMALADLASRIRELEGEIERRVADQRSKFDRAVGCDAALRLGLWQQIRRAPLSFILVAPVIYSLILPLAVLDLFLAVYQAICFRVYGIRKVRRGDFIAIDRHHLAYLNPLEKLNCVYCGYANGLMAFGREVAARTEEYWCPIKHSRAIATPHSRYMHFVDYGDADGYRQRQEALRRHASDQADPPPMA